VKKTANISCVLLLAVLGLRVTVAVTAQAGDTPVVYAQADAFLLQARAAVSQSQAADLVASALQIAPGYSEALYERARGELANRETTLGAVADLRAAIVNASWTTTNPSEAQQALAEVLLRMGRLADARALLLQIAAHDRSDARTFLLLARVYEGEGDSSALGKALAEDIREFPLDDNFTLLLSRQQEREGNLQTARRTVSTQLEVHPGSLSLLLRAAELAPGPSARVKAVDVYTAQGGKDPLASIIALEARASKPQGYLSQFVDKGGLAHEDLVERAVRAVSANKRLATAFQSDLSSFSGSRDLDPDGDGYQERWTFKGGLPISWVRDMHKDGQPEFAAQFGKMLPVSLTVRTPEATLFTISYSTYPYIESVISLISGGGSRTYFLVPYSMTFPFLSAASLPLRSGMAPRALRNPGPLAMDKVALSSYKIEDNTSDGTLVRRIDVLMGKKVFMEESILGTGTFDHLVWFENGQPIRGVRDADGSGKFTIVETWQNGKIASIAVDENGDGKVSYRERYLPSPMKTWYYDETGREESIEYPVGPSTVVQEFSSRLNGVSDITFIWRNGALVQVTRRGQAVSVTHDVGRGLVWIGLAAPSGAPVDASGPDGYRTIAGRNYLIFHHDGVAYAEELP
jgi:tetratricopeptide (TPR) repeat protein